MRVRWRLRWLTICIDRCDSHACALFNGGRYMRWVSLLGLDVGFIWFGGRARIRF